MVRIWPAVGHGTFVQIGVKRLRSDDAGSARPGGRIVVAILGLRAKSLQIAAGHHCVMREEPRFTRLAMVRLGGPGEGVRRYGLARLDEIALATPPGRPVAESPIDEPREDEDGTM